MHSSSDNSDSIDPQLALQVDHLCESFEAAWRRGEQPQIDDWLSRVEVDIRPYLLRELNAVRSALTDSTIDVADTKDFPAQNQSAERVYFDIPGYEVTGEIARGGMGRVFAGRDIRLDREVAIKTLLHSASAERFVIESKITAKLPHPGIPPVYALGTLENGMPYLAMKLIRGQTLSDLLKARSSPNEDLPRFIQIFEQIAQAVGFAHAQGIVHRDLKPQNVMVGEFGEVQVMDWGLAKELLSAAIVHTPNRESTSESPDLGETRSGTILGTPGYMAPEQARGETVDARADVFALGSILAAILTGRPALVGSSQNELIKLAAAGDLSEVHERINRVGADSELTALAIRCLSSTALERPKNGREVAADIAEHRASVESRLQQADTARAEAVVREAEQLNRRRMLQWAGGVVASALLLGIAGTSVGLVRANMAAEKERLSNKQLAKTVKELEVATQEAHNNQVSAETNARNALQEARKSTKLADFLTGMVQVADPVLHGQLPMFREVNRDSFSIDKLLDRGVKQAMDDPELKDFPLARAAILHTIGDVNRQLGHYDAALPLLEEALDLRRKNPSPSAPDAPNPELAASCLALAIYFQENGEYSKAEPLVQEAIDIRRKIPTVEGRRDLATALFTLGAMRGHADELEEAESLFREVIQIRKSLPGDNQSDIAISQAGLAFTLFEGGRNKEALDQMVECQKFFESVSGQKYLPKFAVNFAMATISRHVWGDEFAENQLRSILNSLLEDLDENSVWLAILHFELARVLDDREKYEEAAEHYEASLRISREQVKLRHPRVRILVDRYSRFLANHDKEKLADDLWTEFLAAQVSVFGGGHRVVALARCDHAEYLIFCRRYSEAVEVMQQAKEQAGPETKMGLRISLILGRAYIQGRKYQEAASTLRTALAQIDGGNQHSGSELHVFDAKFELAFSLVNSGEEQEGTKIFSELRTEARRPDGHAGKSGLMDVLSQLLKSAHRTRDFALQADTGMELYKLRGGTAFPPVTGFFEGFPNLVNPLAFAPPAKENPRLVEVRQVLAFALEHLGDFDKALALRREAVTKSEKELGASHAATLGHRQALARCEQLRVEQRRIAGNIANGKSGMPFPKISASFTSEFDKVQRANDGVVDFYPPAFQRWTAYGSKSGTDWLEIEFESETEFSKIELAIYDEGAQGGVQTPADFTAQIWKNDAWVNIVDQRRTSEQPEGNKWNAIEFRGISSKRVRIVFTHPKNMNVPHAKSGVSEIAIWP